MTPKPRSTSKYLVISNDVRLGTRLYRATVIIGGEAIYIFKEAQARAGGALGAAFEAVADRVLQKQDLAGVGYGDIAESVRSDPEWPVRGEPGCAVAVVPRSSVRVMRHTFGGNEIRFEVDGVPVAIQWGDFQGRRIKRFLIQHGWPVVWNGTPHHVTWGVGAGPPAVASPKLAMACVGAGIALAVMAMFVGVLPREYDWVGFILFGGAFAFLMFGVVAHRRGA